MKQRPNFKICQPSWTQTQRNTGAVARDVAESSTSTTCRMAHSQRIRHVRGNHVAVDTSSVSSAKLTGRPKEHGNNVSRTFAQQKVSLSSRAKTRARASPRSNQPPLPLSCPHGRPYLPDRFVRRFIPSSQPQPQPHLWPRPSAWKSAPGKVHGGAEKLLVQNQSASSSKAF